MDLIVHIGSGKTGTTSIQRFLGTNRQALAGHGLLYPSTPGRFRHVRLGLYVTPDDRLPMAPAWHRQKAASPGRFRQEFERDLLDEVAEHPSCRVLFSDEGLFGAPDAALRRLRGFTDGHANRVRLVCYLRRQDDHLISRYQQVVKVGETRRLAERTEAMDLSGTYDYARRLATWENLVDPTELVVRRFESLSFLGGSLFTDFLHAAEVDAPLESFEPVPRQNESLDAESVEFLRILNLHRVRHEGAKRGLIDNRKLIRRLAEARSGPTLTLPEAMLDSFMSLWEEGNREVARRYFADEQGMLFHSPRSSVGTTAEQRLDPGRLDHFLAVTNLPDRLHGPVRELVEQEYR